MKKVILTVAAAVVSSSAVACAMAGGPDRMGGQGPLSGLYVGVGAGWGAMVTPSTMFNSQLNAAVNANNLSHKSNHFVGRADVGYLFNVTNCFFVGPELGYTYLPNTTYSFNDLFYNSNNGKLTDYSLDLLAVAKVYFTSQFSGSAKVGVAYVNQTAKYTASNPALFPNAKPINQKITSDAFMPEVGAALGYNITSNVEATLTYMHAFGKNKNAIQQSGIVYLPSGQSQQTLFGSKVSSYNTIMAGLNYNFGF